MPNRNLSTQNSKNKKRKSPADDFNQALERLARIQKQNLKFAEEAEALATRIFPQIEACEVEKFESYAALVQKLAPFSSKKTLPEYLREELFGWIEELMFKLSSNPFSHKLNLADIESLLAEHVEIYQDNTQQKFLKLLKKDGLSDEDLDNAAELLNELRNAKTPEDFEAIKEKLSAMAAEEKVEVRDETDHQNEDMFGFDESLFGEGDEFEDLFEEFEPNQEDPHEKDLSALIKSSSINKLFRRIARAIHPDLAQDEEEKKQKHELMSELTTARDNRDIATILNLYKTQFGSLPDDLPSDDYPKLTKLINAQIETLKQRKFEALADKPFHAMIYDWFSSKNPKQEAKKVKEFIQESKEETAQVQMLTMELRNLKTLRQILEHRYYSSVPAFEL